MFERKAELSERAGCRLDPAADDIETPVVGDRQVRVRCKHDRDTQRVTQMTGSRKRNLRFAKNDAGAGGLDIENLFGRQRQKGVSNQSRHFGGRRICACGPACAIAQVDEDRIVCVDVGCDLFEKGLFLTASDQNVARANRFFGNSGFRAAKFGVNFRAG
ncbi:hypothetical protein [Labrenzia sp. DG1229]|uniref:hypothetical protein n=1 Tax=Labrenzia sp. DG1229 TaxID=681847 RepID=UPI00048E2275|nr:hypothetical protein [Labrenzia sp. DG1229]